MPRVVPQTAQSLVRSLLHRGAGLVNQILNPRFTELQRSTRGMLNPIVYRRLYRLARRLPDLPIIEVGGATGCASIALALGMKESGKHSKLIVVEKMEGGTRGDVGDYQTNVELVRANFRRYGVQDQIILFPHPLTLENGPEVVALAGGPIAAFMSDADGHLDRDFALFWPRLIPGGAIVVDDYSNRRDTFRPISARHPQGGTKRLLTYRLLNQLMAWGLMRARGRFRDTVFGVKPEGADFGRFDPAVCATIRGGVAGEWAQVGVGRGRRRRWSPRWSVRGSLWF